LGLYWSEHQSTQEYFEGRDHGWEVVGRWFNIVLVLTFAFVATLAAVLRRSRLGTRLRALVDARRLAPSLALIAAWVVVLAVTYGSARFRAVVEPSFAVLAGIGITMAVTALAEARARRSTVTSR
jgi:branched-subunit amino acid ABC-type transport system permease component